MVLPVAYVEMPVLPVKVNVPPPATEPVPVVPDVLIVVDTATLDADVARPNASNVITGMLVEPPYVPEETPEFLRPISIVPVVGFRTLIPFAVAALIVSVSVLLDGVIDAPFAEMVVKPV
jgi:hypothetical protein